MVALFWKTLFRALAKSSMSRYSSQTGEGLESRLNGIRNGNRKPKVPIEKLSTGGTAPALNKDDAWSIVPSPPKVTTRSICCFAAG